MICKCGASAELKKFSTFEYYFCPKCREEVTLSPVVFETGNTVQRRQGLTTLPSWGPPSCPVRRGDTLRCISNHHPRATYNDFVTVKDVVFDPTVKLYQLSVEEQVCGGVGLIVYTTWWKDTDWEIVGAGSPPSGPQMSFNFLSPWMSMPSAKFDVKKVVFLPPVDTL